MLRFALAALMAVGVLVAAATVVAWRELDAALAAGDAVGAPLPRSTLIFDRQGRQLAEVYDEKRHTYISLSEMSPYAVQATIATEDAAFYAHAGVDAGAIVRALWTNFRHGSTVQGGSTITQQLVKNTILPERERFERTPGRKLKEALLAVLLTARQDKEQILEWYLNRIFYGSNSYGLEAAAHVYFGKPARDLSLAESALLAGLPAAPALLDPHVHYARAKERQHTVLELMVRHGFITEGQARVAREEHLTLQRPTLDLEAPHFVMTVREQLEARYGPALLYGGGLRVTTSLDLDLQRRAEAIVSEHVRSPAFQQRNARNAALVALEPTTGEVLAMVGSADFRDPAIDGQVNMALAERQPGSTIKPIVYLSAFAKGWHPATRVLDAPVGFPDGRGGEWSPTNADGRYREWVSAREALATSLNVPAVRALQHAGMLETLHTARQMGLTSLDRNDYGLSLALGSGEVRLLDMTAAYAVLANNGVQVGEARPRDAATAGAVDLDPRLVLRVEDADGRALHAAGAPERRQVVPAPLAYLITSILADRDARAPAFGPAEVLRLGDRPAAVKTGTTDGQRDAWTVGYTPGMVTGVWVGNADGTPMTEAHGALVAAPIWHAFMTTALASQPARPFDAPPGVVRMHVCASSGALAVPGGCGDAREEVFVAGTMLATEGPVLTSAPPPAAVPRPANVDLLRLAQSIVERARQRDSVRDDRKVEPKKPDKPDDRERSRSSGDDDDDDDDDRDERPGNGRGKKDKGKDRD